MSLELKLIPIDAETDDFILGRSIMRVAKDYDLFDKIRELSGKALDKPLCCRDIDMQTTDPTDDKPLISVAAIELLTFEEMVKKGENALNVAVWAYLKASPTYKRFVLYWE